MYTITEESPAAGVAGVAALASLTVTAALVPSNVTVTVEPSFKSIKYIVVSAKKETVNPPKRFFLFRWFQKKQIRLNVDVVEKNPYVQSQDNRFVEIVR